MSMAVLTVACGPGFPQLTCFTPEGVLNVPIRVLVPDSLACIINPPKLLPPCRVTAGKKNGCSTSTVNYFYMTLYSLKHLWLTCVCRS